MMSKDNKIVFEVGLLFEGLTAVVPKWRKKSVPKPFPINLVFNKEHKFFELCGAKHGEIRYEIPARGKWPELVQVDGRILQKLLSTFDPKETVDLVVDDATLQINCGNLKAQLRRIDGRESKGIKTTPKLPDQRHLEPVTHPPEPIGKRVELNDTWLFSARVPVPQHRDKGVNRRDGAEPTETTKLDPTDEPTTNE